MMMNFLKRWRDRREQRRKLREHRQLFSAFATVDQLQKADMLEWDAKQRRLLIAQPLALMMMGSAEKWQNFVRNVYLWTYNQECQHAWEEYMQKEELAAVRSAMADAAAQRLPNLSRQDVERIKRSRRDEIAASDVEPPRVKPFEFFVVADGTDAQPHIQLVGHFDPETDLQELATWDEVRIYLQQPPSSSAKKK